MNTIKLQNPIKINGKEITTLTYDTSKLTVAQFCEAEKHKTASGAIGQVAEIDHAFHLYLAFMAVVAANPDIDVKDLERLKGYDIMQLMKVGQNFLLTGAGGSTESDSGASSETTPEPSEAESAS